MIKVYSSKFSPKPTEEYPVAHATVGDWLASSIRSYRRDAPAPISVMIDGERVPQMDWHSRPITPASDVRVVVEPKGTELFFGGLFLAATRMMSPKIPKMNNISAGDGKDLDSPSAKGNQMKVNDPRPELAGIFKIYGNYLKPMRRYFVDKRDQRVDMCLDLGIGEIAFEPSDMFIGDTNITAYGDNVSFAVYKPGVSIADDQRATWWHDVKEVGSGSDGSTGLTMTEAKDITRSYTASVHRFADKTISIPEGSGSFPADWEGGLIVRILAPYLYDVTDSAEADVISGSNLSMLAPVAGQRIEISGVNQGIYIVRSYSAGSPAVAPTNGSAAYFTGNSSPSAFDFSSSPEVFNVRVGGTDYSITINTNTANLAGLINAINAAKGAAPIQAIASGSAVRIRDAVTPYSGRAVTLSMSTSARIFGSSTTAAAGVAATSGSAAKPPSMTLNLTDGTPATQLTTGSQSMTIGPEGLRYRIATATTQALTVQRLTSSGGTDSSFPGFVSMDTQAALITLDPSSLTGGYRGPFAMCPEDQKTDLIEYDVFHPQGLCGIGREGQIYRVKSFHAFEYRDADLAGAWTRLDMEHSGNTRDAQGVTYRVRLPYAMRAEARIVKRFVAQGGRIDTEKQDEIVWYGCRSMLPGAATVYSRSTVLCMTVRGGDRLSSASENQVWVRGGRVLPVRRNGEWQAPQVTNEIAAYCLHVLKDAGYQDSQLDLAEWDRLGEFWRARGDTFNWLFKDQLTVQQVVDKALACGFAELTVKHGLLTPVRDEPQSMYRALYTYDSQTEGGELSIRFELPSGDDFDGIDVRYMDSRQWQIATVKCRVPGAPAAKRVKVIDADGISNRDKAYQYGMRELMRQIYQRKTCSWSTEMAAFNSYYLDYVQVSGECPGYAVSSVMDGYDAQSATVRMKYGIDWSDIGQPYLASVRRLDGSCFGPVEVTRVSDNSFRLSNPLDFVPQIDVPGVQAPHVMVGQGFSVQITDISPDGTEAASCEGRFYTPEIYTYDDAPAPLGA